MKLNILVDGSFSIFIPIEYIGEQVDSDEFESRCDLLGSKLANVFDGVYMGIMGDKDDE